MFDFRGEACEWEHFASGRAIVSEFGPADQINDDEVWREVANRLAAGVAVLVPVLRPDLIVINGGFGSHFSRFQEHLQGAVAKRLNNMLFPLPLIEASKSPEEAILLGCFFHIEAI